MAHHRLRRSPIQFTQLYTQFLLKPGDMNVDIHRGDDHRGTAGEPTRVRITTGEQ
jgi:hypothetical protein